MLRGPIPTSRQLRPVTTSSSAMRSPYVIVQHGRDEYVNAADPTIHTNTIEGAFFVFNRGMKGVYQNCGKQHLHRYVAEFDCRYNNRVKLGCGDVERAERVLKGVVGKRMKYSQTES